MDRYLPDLGDDQVQVLYPAEISVTMCGTSESRYTVYCFEDNKFDEDCEVGEDECSRDQFHTDQVSNARVDPKDANLPIWDPREYFLMTLVTRVKQVLEEWTRLVQTIEAGFENFISQPLYTGRSRFFLVHNNVLEASEWIQRLFQILRKLLPVIDRITKTWENFNSPNGGDIEYFSDLQFAPCASRIDSMFHEIQHTFERLKELRDSLQTIYKDCVEELRALEIQLNVENNRNTSITMFYICPVTVVSTFFAIPTTIMPFERNALSFTGAVVLVTVVFGLLRLIMGRRIPQPQWWEKIATRAKAAGQGDRTNTMVDPSGHRVLRRRRTHRWHRTE